MAATNTTAKPAKDAQTLFGESLFTQPERDRIFWANVPRVMGMGGTGENPKAVLTELMGTKTPDQIIDAFAVASPQSKPFLEVIKADDEMKAAVKDLLVKDPTALEGLQKLTDADSSITPEQITDTLNDPQNRTLITKMLKATGASDELKFSDFSDALDSGVALSSDQINPAKQKKWKDFLAKYGLEDPRMRLLDQMSDPMKMLSNMWEDPTKFFDDLAKNLGSNPGQIESLQSLGNVFAKFVGMFSEDQGLKDLISNHGPSTGKFFTNLFDSSRSELVGDKGNVGTGTVKPTSHFNVASGAAEPEEKPAARTPVYIPPQPAAAPAAP